jgi:hypothetical protein
VIIVLDAINQFDANDSVDYMGWLPRELPPSVRISHRRRGDSLVSRVGPESRRRGKCTRGS